METKGIRLPDNQFPTKGGEYAKILRQNGETDWIGLPPKNIVICGTFLKGSVVEHEDGTITVEPKLTYNKNYPQFPQWSGYLIKGVWIDDENS